MLLTQRQLDILNHVVVDGQAWANNAQKEEHVFAKVDKYGQAYDEAVAKGGYKNRQQRDEVEAQTAQDKYDLAPYPVKRQRSYPSIADQLDDIYHNGIDAWKATIKVTKDKYPK